MKWIFYLCHKMNFKCISSLIEKGHIYLTLLLLRLLSSYAQKEKNIWKSSEPCHVCIHIGNLSLSTIRWVHICHGFSDFPAFCHHFMLTKLETRSWRVKRFSASCHLDLGYFWQKLWKKQWFYKESCWICVLSNISSTNVFLTLLLPAWFHRNFHHDFGQCGY